MLNHPILLFNEIQTTALQFSFSVGATMFLLRVFALQLHLMTNTRLINFKGASVELHVLA